MNILKKSLILFGILLSVAGQAWTAVYDSTLKAPACRTVGAACDSENLALGRGTMTNGVEPNKPNAIGGACVDGSAGRFHADESIDRLSIRTQNGEPLAAGKTVVVDATVWAYSYYSSDKLDIFYASNANAPAWNLLTTLTPTKSGFQVLSATYTLPEGALQAVRAQFRWGGTASPCASGSYNDRDDLVFAANGAADTTPPQVNISFPTEQATLTGVFIAQGASSDNVEVASVEVSLGGSFVLASGTGTWSRTMDTRDRLNGAATFSVRATDRSGNQTTVTRGVRIDNPLPTVTVMSPDEGTTHGGVLNVFGSASDDGGIARVRVKVDDSSFVEAGAAYWSANIDTRAYGDGPHTLFIEAEDIGGNKSVVSRAVHFQNTDLQAPVIAITSPTEPATTDRRPYMGTVMIEGAASDDTGVSRVEIKIDSGEYQLAQGTGTWSYPLDATTLSNGLHLIQAKAVDAYGNSSTAKIIIATWDSRALYSFSYKAPRCGFSPFCSTGDLLSSRGSIVGQAEANQPNTISNACQDGMLGIYRQDESIERISVRSLDGGDIKQAGFAGIDVKVWASADYASDRLDLYYASNPSTGTATPPNGGTAWLPLGTFTPQAPGEQVISTTAWISYVDKHAVRATFRHNGSGPTPSGCSGGDYDDTDDLVFHAKSYLTPTIALRDSFNGNSYAVNFAVFRVGLPATDTPLDRVEYSLYDNDTNQFLEKITVNSPPIPGNGPPYEFTWSPYSVGRSTGHFRVHAEVFMGGDKGSAGMSFHVYDAQPGNVEILSPSTGTVVVSGVMQITANTMSLGYERSHAVLTVYDSTMNNVVHTQTLYYTGGNPHYSFTWDTAGLPEMAYGIVVQDFDTAGRTTIDDVLVYVDQDGQ